MVEKIAWALNDDRKSVKGSKVLVLGVAYKRDIDDMRESPALDVMRLLEERGADVVYHDPHVPMFREDGHEMHGVPLTDALLAEVDAAVVITDHKSVDYQRIVDKCGLVVDARNVTSKLNPGRARLVQLTSSKSHVAAGHHA